MDETEIILETKMKVHMIHKYMHANNLSLIEALNILKVSVTEYADSIEYLKKMNLEYMKISRKFLT